MSLVIFTGGARSGKSRAAQRLASSRACDGQGVVVAVFGREDARDPEFAERISRHRADRPASWVTHEVSEARGWIARVPPDALLLVDCVGTLLGLVMEEVYAESHGPDRDMGDAPADHLPDGYEANVSERFGRIVASIAERGGDTIVVTNEVGSGVVPAYASARIFRDLLGRTNAYLAERADASYLAVAGRLIPLAACDTEATWPED